MDIGLIESRLDEYLGNYSKYFPIYIEKYSSDLTEFGRKIYNGLIEVCRERGAKPLFFCKNHRIIPETSTVVLCDTGLCVIHSEKYNSYKNRDDGKIDIFFEKFVKYDNVHNMFYKESKLGFFEIWFGAKSKPSFFDVSHPYMSILRNDNGKNIPYDERVGLANNICNFIISRNGNCRLYHD